MLTEHIDALDSQQRAGLKEYTAWWSKAWQRTDANDQEAVSKTIAKIYRTLGRKAPFVVWCDSPWQLAVMPFLLKLVCFNPTDGQRRLLRRETDRCELQAMMRMELARNLNEELWCRAFDSLMCQLEPELELAYAHDAAAEPSGTVIPSIERSIGLCLEKVMAEAHTDVRRGISLNVIEEITREMAQVAAPVMRARLAVEQQLAFQVGRRFSDFNVSIRGGFVRGACELVPQFIRQMGTEFALHVARLLTEDYLPNPTASVGPDIFSEPVEAMREQLFRMMDGKRRAPAPVPWPDLNLEGRLTQAMTDTTLTWGSWSQDFFRIYMFPISVLGGGIYRGHVRERLEELSVLRTGAFMYVFGERVVFACKNPLSVQLDDRLLLHSYEEPAIEFLDGYHLYCWHSVRVPDYLITTPERLTVQAIETERNLELRRVMVERYGHSKYLMDAGARLVCEDECGTLYCKEMPGDEPLVMVKVRNSTPEPDGTYKDYFLRVPPTIVTPRQAVAWTFGLQTDEYQPSVQT